MDTLTGRTVQDATRPDPLADADAYIQASVRGSLGYRYIVNFKGVSITVSDLNSMGYAIRPLGYCAFEASQGHSRHVITCAAEKKKDELVPAVTSGAASVVKG